MKKLFIVYIKLLAAIALIAAGAIHTFPVLWQTWDNQMRARPELHGVIGAIAFTLGIANLFCLFARLSWEFACKYYLILFNII
ncbi:MAG: hypothetical protein HC908_12935 [Calothrix sp. SM1_7_51]|nr:hypothetical protein [Calothrix sp. SM1_7_51]